MHAVTMAIVQVLDRNEFEAVFGAGAAAVPADELADPVALAAARSHIEAAIRMGREVPCNTACFYTACLLSSTLPAD